MNVNDKAEKIKIIVVAGPTASGKTALGVEIAKQCNGEIISADSMQVYKGMTVATAAPTKQEREEAVHHLVEFLDADSDFSVAKWCELAAEKIDEITKRNKIPIIVGGTGLFIDSLVDNIVFENTDIDKQLRERLMSTDGEKLYDELMSVDPEAAKQIHKNNKKRVARALELYYSGTSKTLQNENSRKTESPYDALYLFVNYADRALLYDRINQRVDLMLEAGLEEEARAFFGVRKGTSAQAIGHKELAPYFSGECGIEPCIEKLKRETRKYAKRQITWFKRRKDAVLIQPDALGAERAVDRVLELCKEFLYGEGQREQDG